MDHLEIPKGYYCYSAETIGHEPKNEVSAKFAEVFGSVDEGFPIRKITPCPYWGLDKTLPSQSNGICRFMNATDESLGGGLLWDQVKECGINIECDDADEE